MTTPQAQHWWVVQAVLGARGGQPLFVATESPTRPPDTTQGHTVAGPFATQAEAEAWIAKQTALPSLPGLPNPFGFLAWIQDIGHWTGILVANVTDVHMWISLGWMLLGMLLLGLGISLWLRLPQKVAAAGAEAARAAV